MHHAPYQYDAKLLNIVDGDTLDFTFDLGFEIYMDERVRLENIDTGEIRFADKDSEEYQLGVMHLRFVCDWLDAAQESWDEGTWPFVVLTTEYNRGAYGRLLGYVFRKSDGRELTSDLRDEFGEEVTYE